MYKFCPKCGASLQNKIIDGQSRLVCQQCGFIFYINPTPAVGVILLQDEKILLVKRKYQPRQGYWSLPAGFLEYDETIEQTAVREAKEETNLDIKLGELFGVYSGFDDPRVHVLLVIYRAEIVGGDLQPGDDASEARFFALDELPSNVAFSSHKLILEKLRKELSKTFEVSKTSKV